jgi:hypothetical protein
MLDMNNIQVMFFRHLKSQLPAHLSVVDEIAEVLKISTDSAYRRLRGEKPISFEELQILCGHFRISLDQFLHLKNDSILFSGKAADADNFSFEDYLKNILQLLSYMNSFEPRELFYLNKDIPIFHHFSFPELAAFKYFFWMKTILHYPEYARTNFSFDLLKEPLMTIGKKIADAYMHLPSQEIWNVESINSTIRQIEYYKNTRVFSSVDDVKIIYDSLDQSIDHIERQAELGYKFALGDEKRISQAPYKVYFNEFILGDNTILAILKDEMITFINHSVINIIMTRDRAFCEYTHQHFRNLTKKSTLISEVGEKDRSRFFNIVREKISSRKNALLHE